MAREDTQWKKGQSGNPGGLTSAQIKANKKAAESAARIKAKWLGSLEKLIESQDSDDPEKAAEAAVAIIGLLNTDTRQLVESALDREFGKPKQAVEHGGDPANPITTVNRIEIVAPGDDSED